MTDIANDYVNWLELAWTLTGAIGLVLSLWSLHSSYEDWKFREATTLNGTMKKMAMAHIRMSIIRTVINLMVISIGILALNTSPSPYPRTSTGWLITTTVVLIPILIMINTALDRRLRNDLINMVDHH